MSEKPIPMSLDRQQNFALAALAGSLLSKLRENGALKPGDVEAVLSWAESITGLRDAPAGTELLRLIRGFAAIERKSGG